MTGPPVPGADRRPEAIARQLCGKMRVMGALVAVALLLGAAPHAAQPARLSQLGGIDELKTWFNSGTEHLRLIFLLSPT